MEMEQAMLTAVAQGNKTTATALLNELLGHIFFFSPDPAVIQTRVAGVRPVIGRHRDEA